MSDQRVQAAQRTTDEVVRRVDRATRILRVLAILAVLLVLASVIVLGVVTIRNQAAANRKLVDAGRDNHHALVILEQQTNPATVARQQRQLGGIISEIIGCVENHADRVGDQIRGVSMRPRLTGCPPDSPISVGPLGVPGSP